MRNRGLSMAWVTALAAVAILVAPTTGSGQVRDGSVAAPYLAPDHWAINALRRLDAAGLLGGEYSPAMPGIKRVEAFRLLERAREEAASSGSDAALRIDGYLERLRQEFPGARLGVDGAAPGWRPGGQRVSAGFRPGGREMLTTVGTPPTYEMPWEPDDAAELRELDGGLVGAVDLSGYWGGWAAVHVTGELDVDRVHLGETYAVLSPGPVDLWLGRRSLRLGYGDGGIIVSGALPLDGVGVAVDSVRLPWLLGALGPIRISNFVGRAGYSAPHDDPWMWLLRVQLRPHERLGIGLQRAAMAVPVDGGVGDRLQQIGYIAIGKHGTTPENNMRDNQMASLVVRYRPPLGAVPLQLHLEWGLDDSAGSWQDVPGIVGGAYVGAVPGASWLGVGLERAHFAPRCCGNIWWYRHSGFQGGWSDERRVLGHPLGGHGDEWAGRVDMTLLGGRATLESRGYARDRGDENLFAPTFEGRSVGGSIRLSSRLGASTALDGELQYESGADGWSRQLARFELSVFF